MLPKLKTTRVALTFALIILLTPPLFLTGLATIAAAPMLLAVVVRTFIVQPFRIPANSMFPTLQNGDLLLASKFAYGYKRFSYFFNSGPEINFFDNAPKRGEVVIFRFPPDPSIDYVKRVIGESGDRIRVTDGRLYINDVIVPRERQGTTPIPGTTEGHLIEFLETLPGGKKHVIVELSDNERGDNTREFTVPAGHYFMMGDNRDNSADSRFDVGFVPEENVYAKASFVLTNETDRNRRNWVD